MSRWTRRDVFASVLGVAHALGERLARRRRSSTTLLATLVLCALFSSLHLEAEGKKPPFKARRSLKPSPRQKSPPSPPPVSPSPPPPPPPRPPPPARKSPPGGVIIKPTPGSLRNAPLPPMSEFVATQLFSPCYFINSSVPTLWDGAQQAYRLGSRVFKFGLSDKMALWYRWNNDQMPWPDASNLTSLTQVAQSPQVAGLFSNAPELGTDFKTFIMWTYRVGRPGDYWYQQGNYWCQRFDPVDAVAETAQFSELTQYLMQNYEGTGRTFVLEHWEGDWALRCGATNPATGAWWGPTWPLPQSNADNMTRWLQARQTGVEQGRTAYCKQSALMGVTIGVDCSDGRAVMDAANVFVYHGAVVNLVATAMSSSLYSAMITAVVPRVALDTLGYSSYETQGTPQFSQALDFMYSQMNRTKASPPRPINVAEWGFSLTLWPTSAVAPLAYAVMSTCLKKPYVGQVVHWQAINNHPNSGLSCMDAPLFDPASQGGFMVVSPNGTLSWYGQFLQGVINGSVTFS